jgi:ribose transport system substrate-binding protein
MKSFARIDAILSCFPAVQRSRRISEVLQYCGIPRSSGHKLVNDMLAHDLLVRSARGHVALGPSARGLMFSPMRADMPLRVSLESKLGRTIAGTPRRPKFDQSLLEIARTDHYRCTPPFSIGFANASLSHPWRLAMERSLRAAARRQQPILSELVITNAHNDPYLQAEQILQMKEQKVDLCILSAATEENVALSAAIKSVVAAGIPIIGVDRICGERRHLVSFITASDEMVGRLSAVWLAEQLKGKGRILMLCGLQGASPCTNRLKAASKVFSGLPEIEVIAVEYTDWLAERGYEIVRGFLRRNVVPDGVWCDSGLQGVGSLKAFLNSGIRGTELPPHTGGEINLMYKLAISEGMPLCGVDYPPAMGAVSFQTALDALHGRQVPRLIECNLEIVVTRGHETKSVRADIHAERKVAWNRSADHVHADGLHGR